MFSCLSRKGSGKKKGSKKDGGIQRAPMQKYSFKVCSISNNNTLQIQHTRSPNQDKKEFSQEILKQSDSRNAKSGPKDIMGIKESISITIPAAILEQNQNLNQLIAKAVFDLTNVADTDRIFWNQTCTSSLEGIPKIVPDPQAYIPKQVQVGSQPSQPKSQTQESNLSFQKQILNVNLNQELSKCVIEQNYQIFQSIFSRMSNIQKNAYDSRGLTPLYLLTVQAIRYNQKSDNNPLILLKKVLKDHEINPLKKLADGSKPIEEAIMKRNIPILTNLFRASYLFRRRQIKKGLRQLANAIQTIPDLEIELYVKVGSFLPLVQKFTPDDTISIFKKGRSLRIDYTLVGYSFLSPKRRRMSCIIQKLDGQDYTILIVNHDKQIYADLLQPLEDEELILMIQDLLSIEIKRKEVNVISTQIKEQKNIFNKIIRQRLCGGIATMHTLKVNYSSKTEKVGEYGKKKQSLGYLKDWVSYQKHERLQRGEMKQKQIQLGVWLKQECMLKLEDFLSLIKFLSFSHETGQIIYNFLSNTKIQEKLSSFPFKLQIPVNFSFYIDMTITKLASGCSKAIFDYRQLYCLQRRCEYQKTVSRKEKRLTFISLFT